jgi:hypothetical protein
MKKKEFSAWGAELHLQDAKHRLQEKIMRTQDYKCPPQKTRKEPPMIIKAIDMIIRDSE